MNITDKQYKNLSNEVYNLDPGNKKYNPSLKEEVIFRTGNTNFKILKAEDNPDNGMQVRTVGAIKGGEVGKNYIVIVYAGINHLTAI
ncbi:hypothetical protein [Streptococcus equi]|uniref:hypothetical protein n=1 Tax=Streptococcus equi TaxID=1336 RepID=UPI0013F5AB93|nr:hypothetical protein [Streptococcus equi]HEK9998608.1 hypothetical protein [Streptococcus equi subsp. zooepidemicus]